MDTKQPCRCSGMNEECVFCGGSGFQALDKVLIIRTTSDPEVLKKEELSLKEYLHPAEEEKKYTSPLTKHLKRNKQKKTITLKDITKEEPLKYVGPDNPNRKTWGDTRKMGAKKKGKSKKRRKR